MTITTKNGEVHILSPEELETAYREKEKQYLLEDAESQLLSYYDIDEDLANDNCRRFKELYGFDIDAAIDPDSKHYLLNKMVDRFHDEQDCEVADNDTWENIIVSIEKKALNHKKKAPNKYAVVLKYFTTVEVEASNYYEAIEKAHEKGGSLQGADDEEVTLLEGAEPEYEGDVPPLAGSNEEAAAEICRHLHLGIDEYERMVADIANLRGKEILEYAESHASPFFVKQLKQYVTM